MAKPFKGDIFDWAYVPGGSVFGQVAGGKSIRTSRVTSIHAEGDTVICETQNSIYHLRTLMPTVEQMQQRSLVSG